MTSRITGVCGPATPLASAPRTPRAEDAPPSAPLGSQASTQQNATPRHRRNSNGWPPPSRPPTLDPTFTIPPPKSHFSVTRDGAPVFMHRLHFLKLQPKDWVSAASCVSVSVVVNANLSPNPQCSSHFCAPPPTSHWLRTTTTNPIGRAANPSTPAPPPRLPLRWSSGPNPRCPCPNARSGISPLSHSPHVCHTSLHVGSFGPRQFFSLFLIFSTQHHFLGSLFAACGFTVIIIDASPSPSLFFHTHTHLSFTHTHSGHLIPLRCIPPASDVGADSAEGRCASGAKGDGGWRGCIEGPAHWCS